MAEQHLKELEKKVDELIALCQELNRENQALKADSSGWRQERQDALLSRRLKELEQENSRLKKLLAEAEVDKAILKEAMEGNW